MINAFSKNNKINETNGLEKCNLTVCLGTYATVPYYYEGAEVSFWSIEELCFYITENACLIERSFADERLIDWIAKECNLSEIARELQKYVNKKEAVEHFVRIILEKNYYLPTNEITELLRVIHGQLGVDTIATEKGRADYFLGKGRKRKAIGIYRTLIYQIDEKNNLLKSKVMHNMGVAYAGLFEFQKAAICFWDAYELTYQKVHYHAYLSAKRMQLKESEYIDFIATQQDKYEWYMEFEQIMSKTMGDYDAVSDITEWSQCKANRKAETYEEFLNGLQEEYKRNES